MIQQHVLSPNWSERHKIYPVVEKDQLMDLLESALRRLHLWDLKKASAEVSARLQGELVVDTERELLAQKSKSTPKSAKPWRISGRSYPSLTLSRHSAGWPECAC